MWASCMFIHEMRLESSASVYIVVHSLPLFLLGLEASWQKLPVFVSLTSHSFSHSLSFLPPVLPFSMDCEPVGGLIEDAFLWGTKVMLFRRYASLSKADTQLKNYSPRRAPQQPVERLWKGLKGMGDTGRLPLSSHHCVVMWEAGVKSFIRSGRRCLQSPR